MFFNYFFYWDVDHAFIFFGIPIVFLFFLFNDLFPSFLTCMFLFPFLFFFALITPHYRSSLAPFVTLYAAYLLLDLNFLLAMSVQYSIQVARQRLPLVLISSDDHVLVLYHLIPR